MPAKEGEDFEVWKLFIAGAVTAAGAAFFWWLHKTITAKREEEAEDLELEAIMIANAATNEVMD